MSACALVLACAAAAAAGAAPAKEAELFGDGVVSTGDFESHPAFTPDGRTLYFVKSTPSFTDWKIWMTERTDAGWSQPKPAPFSKEHRDADPYVTPDGKRLYFISDRPVDGKPKEDMDIWVMERKSDGGWGEPRNLGAPVNSSGSEWLPRPAASGALYFGSDRSGGLGKTDLYRSALVDGKYAAPENLGPSINSAAEEYEPCIAADESFLVFMAAGRPDDTGAGDLYISYRKDGTWSPAKNLGPTINRRALEIGPYLSLDGKSFYFSSARKAGGRNGLGDIYRIDVDTLHALARGGGTAAEAAPEDPALRRRVLAMARDDQTDPTPPGSYERNGAWIREIVAEHGWPGKSLVGVDGAHAAWLVVQHQDHDVVFQRRCLEQMRLAFESGEVTAYELSFLTDRVLSNEGKPQMYGTQSVGVRSPEDEARVDANRFALGLPPWREFIAWRQEHHGPWLPPVE